MKKSFHILCVLILIVVVMCGCDCNPDQYLTWIPEELETQYDEEYMKEVRKAALEIGAQVIASGPYDKMLYNEFDEMDYDYVIPINDAGFITITLKTTGNYDQYNMLYLCYFYKNNEEADMKCANMDLEFFSCVLNIFTALTFTQEDYQMILDLQNHNKEGGTEFLKYRHDFNIRPKQGGLPFLFSVGEIQYSMFFNNNERLSFRGYKSYHTDKLTKEFKK